MSRRFHVPRPGRRTVVAAAVLLVIAVALVARMQSSPRPDSGPPPGAGSTASQSPPDSTEKPEMAGPRPPSVDPALMRGARDAPVTMVVFGDYQCPYCAAFAEDQQPALVEEYVDTGRLRLVWRDYPYRGKDSEEAAVAARAAARQDEFWAYSETLYADTGAWKGGGEAGFTRIAGDLGLDVGRFADDIDDPSLRTAVDDDMAFALGLGVPGTPAFLIDGEAFFGAQPIAEFKKRIEAAEPP